MSSPEPISKDQLTTYGAPRLWVPELLTLAVTLAVYWRNFRFSFAFDDWQIIVRNPTVQSWSFFPDYFTRHLWQNVLRFSGYYRPLALLWFRLNDAAFGLRPAGWHITSVLLHALVSVLVLRLTWKLSSNRMIATVAGLLFALHPVHAETASWISDAVDAMVTAWILGAMICFLRSRTGSRWWLVASLGLYVGALLTKEPGIMMPAIAFCYMVIFESVLPFCRRVRNAAVAIVWYLPVAATYLLVRHVALHGYAEYRQSISPTAALLTVPEVLWTYARLLLVPFGLSPFYDVPLVKVARWGTVFVPLIALVALVVLGWMIGRRMKESRVAKFGLAWSVVTILPVLDLAVFLPNEMVHDRYIYLSSVGFCIFVAAILGELELRSEYFAISISAGMLILLGASTFSFAKTWQNDATMFARGVQVAPRNETAELGLANEVAKRGNLPLAISLYHDILKRDPDHLFVNSNLGWLYLIEGKYPEAEQYLKKAVSLSADRPDAILHLGELYTVTGRLDDAEEYLRKAEAIAPQMTEVHQGLSVVLEKKGELSEAVAELQAAIKSSPEDPQLRVRLQELQSKLKP